MKSAIPLIVLLVTTACAQKPEAIQAAYISPTTYAGFNCSQLSAEAKRVDAAYTRAAAQQTKARSNDTVGVIFLGLPVSSLSGENVAPQIADLKGRKETIHQTQISRGCVRA